jgi:hypothetical protein
MRIEYHFFSYGAWLGAITAAVDTRVGLLVLRSGGPQILTEIARASARTLTHEYAELIATSRSDGLRPEHRRTRARPERLARYDLYRGTDARMAGRIGGAKTVRSYDAGHTLDTTANAEALVWIAERWRL